MSYGLRVTNPSGTLVLDSEATHYRFLSSPTPLSNGSVASEQAYPYVFRVTTPGADQIPLTFVRPKLNEVVKVVGINQINSTTWDIEVMSFNILGHSESMRNVTPVAPTIHVFCPMSASADTYGLRLFNAAGNCTFDSAYRPFSIKGTSSFPIRSGGYLPYSWYGDGASLFNGDFQSFSGYTNLAVCGNPNGYADTVLEGSGEYADRWDYGWHLSSTSQLARYRFWSYSEKPSYTLDWNTATIEYYRSPMTAICIEASGL